MPLFFVSLPALCLRFFQCHASPSGTESILGMPILRWKALFRGGAPSHLFGDDEPRLIIIVSLQVQGADGRIQVHVGVHDP